MLREALWENFDWRSETAGSYADPDLAANLRERKQQAICRKHRFPKVLAKHSYLFN
jgi:hypothetical protein